MPALKSFFVLATFVVFCNARLPYSQAAEPGDLKEKVWTVTPRGSKSKPSEPKQSIEPIRWRPAQGNPQAALVEELPTAEPPALKTVSRPSSRSRHARFDSINSILPVQFIASLSPLGSRSCDELGCDDIGCDSVRCGGTCDGLNCNGCARTYYWGRVDYLYWWLDGSNVPPLVTTSPVGTGRADAGVLGLSTTGVLVGANQFGESGQSGGRIEFGRWFPDRGNLGWHFAYLGLSDAKDNFAFSSPSVPILARPFFSVEPASVGQNAELVSFPGELEGNVAVGSSTSYDAAEFMFRWIVANNAGRKLHLTAGFQYNGLEDDLRINDFRRVIGGQSSLAIGTTLTENDRFQADNRFGGVALGVLGSSCSGRTTLDWGMRLGLGNNRSKVSISGATTATVPTNGGPDTVVTTTGGLLAQGTNIGSYENDTFAVVPELHFDVGYHLYPQVRLLAGYRFVYWSQVARAAEQIDTSLNLSQLDPAGLVGEPRPQFNLRLTDFWAQGLNVGLDYRF